MNDIVLYPDNRLRRVPPHGNNSFLRGVDLAYRSATGPWAPSAKLLWDESYEYVLENMMSVMVEKDGIGIAANQVGFHVNLFLVSTTCIDPNQLGYFDVVSYGTQHAAVFRGPKEISREGEGIALALKEGCLSVPDRQIEIRRGRKCMVEVAVRPGYAERKVFTFFAYSARVVQHELDHLAGRLIVDYEEKSDAAEG